MGVAEVIPGISGSTAALLTGIYEELIRSIKSINKEALKLLLEKKFDAFWKHINGNFLANGLCRDFYNLFARCTADPLCAETSSNPDRRFFL